MKVEQATEHGEKFANLFYETFDKNRHVSTVTCYDTLRMHE